MQRPPLNGRDADSHQKAHRCQQPDLSDTVWSAQFETAGVGQKGEVVVAPVLPAHDAEAASEGRYELIQQLLAAEEKTLSLWAHQPLGATAGEKVNLAGPDVQRRHAQRLDAVHDEIGPLLPTPRPQRLEIALEAGEEFD